MNHPRNLHPSKICTYTVVLGNHDMHKPKIIFLDPYQLFAFNLALQKDIKNGALTPYEQWFHILNAITYVTNLDPYSLRLVGLTAGRQSDEIIEFCMDCIIRIFTGLNKRTMLL